MGGCLGKKGSPINTRRSMSKKKDPASETGANGAAPSPLLPLPPEEDAVVKEVLTETPNSSAFAISSDTRRAGGAKVRTPGMADLSDPTSANGCRFDGDGRSEEEEEVEASDMCSASESFSVSTTLTEKREDEEEETAASQKGASKWRPRPHEWSPAGKGCHHQRKRSSSGDFLSRRDAKGGSVGGGRGRSPPSAANRSDGRSFLGKDAATARQRAGKGTAAGTERRDRYHGEKAGRTSVSPAAKRLDLGAATVGGGRGRINRKSSTRKAGVPGRASPERSPLLSEVAAANRTRGGAAVEDEVGEGVMLPAPGSEETLENPLVSLECFIFL